MFKNATGRLNGYAFACGYIERKSTDIGEGFRETDLSTELYAEHGVYHVRQFDRREGETTFRVFWYSTGSLTEARARFDAEPGEMDNGV